MKKLCSVFILLSILSCSDKDNSKKSDVSKMQKVEYIYKDGGRDIPVEITSPPQRAALFVKTRFCSRKYKCRDSGFPRGIDEIRYISL